MKTILLDTKLSIRSVLFFLMASFSILFTSCLQDEDSSVTNIDLPGVINFCSVGIADFSTPNTRSTTPVIVDTIKIANNIYAEVSIVETPEVSTRATGTNNLPKDTRFRLLALDNNDIKADIIYRIKDNNGGAEIVSGSGDGYKIGSDGKKYFQLDLGKKYKMVGFSDGTSNTPGSFTDPLIYAWESNYMKFATTLTISDGENQFVPTFQHMNAAMQIVINTTNLGDNITAASAVMWQENNLPVDDKWSYSTDQYLNNISTTNGSETNGAPFIWTNPNSQNVASDLQYFTPGDYGNIKIKFKNITVGGVNYNSMDLITLDPIKMTALQRNKKYIVTVNFISPTDIRPLNIFVPACSMTHSGTAYGVSDGTAYDISTGNAFAAGQELPASGGAFSYLRYASTCVGIFENPEYFGRYASYTKSVGKFNAVKWWSASKPSDITEANLKKAKIDIIFYSSEHLVNVAKNGVAYVNLITTDIANEMYNYHMNNTNTGLLLITGSPSTHGPSSSYPNYFIQKYFGPVDVSNTGESALEYDAISSWSNVLYTGNATEANNVTDGVGDFIYTNGIFSATGNGTLEYGAIPQNRALRWALADAEDCTYHDAAYSSYMITNKLKARDPYWISVFYGQQNVGNSNINVATQDMNKTVLAYNPKLRMVWTPGASQWGYPYGSNCSARYSSPLNYSGPMNAWTNKVKPVYINPLTGTPDNSNLRYSKRYGSRAMYGCIADMIIRNNIGRH